MMKPKYHTALITGASSGLGYEYARQLASEGSHLVLVARRIERLENLARELSDQYGIEAKALQADLSTPEGVETVEAQIAQLPELDLLVNNAGYGLRGSFSSDPIQKHLDLIHVQVNASVRLARAALEGMCQRKRGAIINVSSLAAFLPLRNVTYSAAKAYLVNFSEALQNELYGSGIKIQALCAGFVVTEFHDTEEMTGFRRSSIPKLLWLEAADVVNESLKRLEGDQVIVVPSWQYRFVTAFARQPVTASLVRIIARQLFTRRKSYEL